MNSPPTNTPSTGSCYFGMGIYVEAAPGSACNIGVLESSFEGGTNTNSYITNGLGAANGFLWFQQGGNWFALRNFVTNNAEEAMQFNAGPTAVAGNTFYSWANNPACCALNADAATAGGLTGAGASNYWTTFVGNSVWGNEYGELGSAANITSDYPYTINFSGNYLYLFLPADNPSVLVLSNDNPSALSLPGAAVQVNYCQQANVCGNTLANGGEGVSFAGASANSVILANNFVGVAHSSVLDLGQGALTVQDGQVMRNILGRGDGDHMKVPFGQGLNWFLYQNQYLDSYSNSVPPFTDAANLPAHISY